MTKSHDDFSIDLRVRQDDKTTRCITAKQHKTMVWSCALPLRRKSVDKNKLRLFWITRMGVKDRQNGMPL